MKAASNGCYIALRAANSNEKPSRDVKNRKDSICYKGV